MPNITQEMLDFWDEEHFNFENFYSIHPVTGMRCVGLSRTKFNYIHYLEYLLHLERKKKANQPSSLDSES